MSEIKDTRFIKDKAVRDEDILLDNNDWLRGRNAANSADINLLKVDAGDRLHLGDAATGKPVVMGAQLSADPTGIAAGFYYNTTLNKFRFYNGTTWGGMSGDDPSRLSDGSASAPAYSFASDTNTGLFLLAPDVISIGVGGVNKVAISTTDLNFAGLSTNYLSGTSVAKFWNTPGTYAALLRGNAAQSASTLFQLPIDNGTAGFVLQTDGSGVTSWVAQSGSSVLNTVLYFEDSSNINISAPGDAFDNVGFVVTAGDRIWLNFQTTPTENGMWIWNGNAVPLTRPTGWTNGSIIPAGTLISVTGNVSTQHNRFTTWLTGYADKVVGTDDLVSTLHGFGSVVGYNLIPWVDNSLTVGEPGKGFSAVYTNNVITGNDLTLQGTRAFLYGAGESGGLSIEIYNSSDTDNNGGYIKIHTGNEQDAADVTSGTIQVYTGNTDSGNSGELNFFTGDADDVNGAGLNAISSGNITFSTGEGLTDSKSGYIHIGSGPTNGGDGDSGEVTLFSGETLNGISGAINIATGYAAAAQSGQISISSGIADGDTGLLYLLTGNSISNNTGEIQVRSGSSGGAGTGNTGGVALLTGDTTSGTSGLINIITGSAPSGTRGAINLNALDINISADNTFYVAVSAAGRMKIDGGALNLTRLASDPTGVEGGDCYFNTTINKIKVFNGSSWETVTSV